MGADTDMQTLVRQHLIDPETCIRCNTCESRCPTKAIRHERNYVVDPEKCNFCMRCVRPCPTGAVEHFLHLAQPYSVDEQLSWIELPPALQVASSERTAIAPLIQPGAHRTSDLGDMDGGAIAPASAATPRIDIFTSDNPARAVVSDNYRITGVTAENDVHHIILEFADAPFPFLEGQSVGIIRPGIDGDGKPHDMRLYSVACARDGEKPGARNMALAVKRVIRRDEQGRETRGVGSNWLCDLMPGDTANVVGPFGSTFLLPEDPEADLLMICTGTGVAPFRGFTHRRRRTNPNASGKLILIFGARAPEELPYYIALQKYAQSELHRELVYSRLMSSEREYVQDRLRQRAREVGWLLRRPTAHIFLCGSQGLEEGVDEAITEIVGGRSIDWLALKSEMRRTGRYHIEVY
jgi:benzoyl-CoA 2,3-epoxidase subunit A